MDENKKDNPGYEPNFILKDNDTEPAGDDVEPTEYNTEYNINPNQENISERSDKRQDSQEIRVEGSESDSGTQSGFEGSNNSGTRKGPGTQGESERQNSSGTQDRNKDYVADSGENYSSGYESTVHESDFSKRPEDTRDYDGIIGSFRDPRENFRKSAPGYGYGNSHISGAGSHNSYAGSMNASESATGSGSASASGNVNVGASGPDSVHGSNNSNSAGDRYTTANRRSSSSSSHFDTGGANDTNLSGAEHNSFSQNHTDYGTSYSASDYNTSGQNTTDYGASGQNNTNYGASEQSNINYGGQGQSSTGQVYHSVNDSSDYVNSWNNGSDKVKKKRVKKSSPAISLTRRSLALIIALCVVVSGVFGLGGAFLGNSLFDENGGTEKKASASTKGYTLEDATGSNMTVQEITEAAKSSVVEIKTESVSSDAWMQQYVTEGAGSGVIITNDGYIMTNNHVIDGASKITVTTADEKEYEAKLIGTDSITDVAVLKIDAKDLTPATYGNSDQLEVGDLAVAIGNPLGELGGTVTAGIISALDRQLSIDGKTMTLLQTDSSINPGNSGGGLFNDDGQLIGIVVAKSSGSDVEGLGFAIPINKAADVAQQLMEKGYVSGQPSTGMSYSEANSQGNGMNQFFGSQGSQSSVVYIHSVNGTSAKKAGFKEGDIVYAVDGTEITSFNELSSIVTAHEVGDKLTFTVIRNNQKIELKLTLEEKQAGE